MSEDSRAALRGLATTCRHFKLHYGVQMRDTLPVPGCENPDLRIRDNIDTEACNNACSGFKSVEEVAADE
jgi:hypothetical protein